MKDFIVLDLAGKQGRFCSKLLADLGAVVVRPAIDLRTAKGRKRFRALIKKSDVLVENFRPSTLECTVVADARLRKFNPRLIHLSMTPFGRSGPRQNYLSSDTVDSAFGGQLYVSGPASGPPRETFRLQSYYTASLFGAVATLLRLRKRRITGKGSYVDLSIQEAVVSTLGSATVDFFHSGKIAGRGERDSPEGFAILKASDGYVQLTINRSWDTLLELMAGEKMAGNLLEKEWQDPSYREEHYGHVITTIEAWTRLHSKQELFELGQAMHFAWAPISSIEEVLNSPQLKFRNFFHPAGFWEGGASIAAPGPPYKITMPNSVGREQEKRTIDQSLARKSCPDEEILKGIRVLDLTRMLSGPYATRILADFGAEVIKIQSAKTAQGAEQNDMLPFSAWNRNKQSITLDLDTPEARNEFLMLAAESDVVVENFSPRVMANWGLGYEQLKSANPRLVMMSISAMGQTGPWRDFVGLAPTFHALSGLITEVSRKLDLPAGIGNPYGDFVAGLYAALAILSGLESRDETGLGRHIDLSAYEALCSLLIDSKIQTVDAEYPRSLIYQCAGEDRWCVITLNEEGELEKLCGTLGIPDFSDETIGRWISGRTAESVVQRLQNCGIAAGVVQNASDLAKDPQLKERRFFISLNHPVFGKVMSDRSALWDWRRKPKNWKSSPLLGEDNHQYEID